MAYYKGKLTGSLWLSVIISDLTLQEQVFMMVLYLSYRMFSLLRG